MSQSTLLERPAPSVNPVQSNTPPLKTTESSQGSTHSSGHSIFDCPLQTHTSPTSTFFNSILFFPCTTKVSGPPAFNLPSFNVHLPSLAFAVACSPRKVTVTSSPSSAHPQTGTRIPCC